MPHFEFVVRRRKKTSPVETTTLGGYILGGCLRKEWHPGRGGGCSKKEKKPDCFSFFEVLSRLLVE